MQKPCRAFKKNSSRVCGRRISEFQHDIKIFWGVCRSCFHICRRSDRKTLAVKNLHGASTCTLRVPTAFIDVPTRLKRKNGFFAFAKIRFLHCQATWNAQNFFEMNTIPKIRSCFKKTQNKNQSSNADKNNKNIYAFSPLFMHVKSIP